MQYLTAILAAALVAGCNFGGSGGDGGRGLGDIACGETVVADSPGATADWFTQATPALEPGQFELVTLSTLPDTVTGGDVLLAVRGLDPDDCLTVAVGGRDVTAAFARSESGDTATGLVGGLEEGANRIDASAVGPAGARAASLTVRNHSITGPVISGPHQEPFICRTAAAGLGEPLDEDCSIETRVQWFYRSALTQQYAELANPYADYPPDTALTTLNDGSQVPFVVRVETATINRGITRIAVLDDPAARGPEAPFEPHWNDSILYSFGESCGVGYHQGVNDVDSVLGALPLEGIDTSSALAPLIGIADMLGRGYMTIHSTMTTLGVHCNQLLSAESLMMIKEHVIERYGPVERVIGTGGSGGAIQQWTTANNNPGLIDAGSPLLSFPDVITTAMSPVDCGLLAHYFDTADVDWNEFERAAASGHIGTNICTDWNDLFTDHVKPSVSCDGSVPDELIYDPETNPGGVRCTLQDTTVNIWGTDPDTGFARRPVDNVGVQYGLLAFNEGAISAEQFVDLNESIGGFDIDGNIVDRRMAMSPELAALAHRIGAITGGGAVNEIPFIDLNLYVDPIPVLGFHDQVRSYMLRARMQARLGTAVASSIWNGVPNHGTVYPQLEAWLDNLDSLAPVADREGAVFAAKPPGAADRCTINLLGTKLNLAEGVTLPLGVEVGPIPGVGTLLPGSDVPVALEFAETAEYQGDGVCDTVFRARRSTRIVAGGPLAEDVVKCRLKPLDTADYARPLTDDQMARLRAAFPDGVCDWSRPGVGADERSLIWASLGGEERLPEPVELRWRVARSVDLD